MQQSTAVDGAETSSILFTLLGMCSATRMHEIQRHWLDLGRSLFEKLFSENYKNPPNTRFQQKSLVRRFR